MSPSRLQHVSSPFPEEDREALRAFYTKVLGLTELAAPAALSHLRVMWFSAGDGLELHFFPGVPDKSSTRHFCLDVDDLKQTRIRLAEAGGQPYDDVPIPGRPRFFCRDPVGNLVEFTTIESIDRRPRELDC
jgi:catechol 2,3-dioxygenase-like lactoylglutathione lyase family enzyme